ncbi:hypothetical protein [Streptomyces collinus]|uniref:tRNA wybutosine-synthesis domain-containing protein n=1 Tax=Streptomyces collinus (strain DSM 40733 / Tue 365) TaxID=1214242 RepID=S5UXU5_STRC3|nr:hypothetical protein [Streptomyces collinus]AGS67829.1 hypothetical protein B446_05005 [Streptomyces collinus Tu 365]UJA06460.1 hypothetical protein HGI10_03410 [Streptomyces collinus]UJA12370.1 hypothetical protein HGI10_63530 [Streptomyces collinus]UJA12767.1 hypothetical protein HGI09_00600 [Streptomyces collinus]UJA18671.1 hypothetical protein HGI09_60660 [Streptomyces collinus]
MRMVRATTPVTVRAEWDPWVWGPEAVVQRVRGSAVDFCLCVTRRRPWSGTDMTATGEDARKWLEVARVFL